MEAIELIKRDETNRPTDSDSEQAFRVAIES